MNTSRRRLILNMLPRLENQAAAAGTIIYKKKIRPFLGVAFTYAQLAYEYLEDNFGSNVAANIGLSKSEIKKAIEVIAAIYQKNWAGFGRKDHQAVRDYALGLLEWPANLSQPLGKLLFFLEDVGPAQPILNDWFNNKIGPMSFVNNWSANTQTMAAKVAQGTKDIALETIDTIAKGAGNIINKIDENLPWYLKLKIIVPAGLIFLAWLYLPKPKRPAYKSNPISKKAYKVYEDFHDMPVKKITSIPEIDTKNLVKLGQALEIGYKSKKWTGKNENYLHQFGKKISLFVTDDGKNLIIAGKNLKVQPEGITG